MSVEQLDAQVFELNKQIQFKGDMVGLVDDLLAAPELYVPESYLKTKRIRLLAERQELELKLELIEQCLAAKRGSKDLLLS